MCVPLPPPLAFEKFFPSPLRPDFRRAHPHTVATRHPDSRSEVWNYALPV